MDGLGGGDEDAERRQLLHDALKHNKDYQIAEGLTVNLFDGFVDWKNFHCLGQSADHPFPHMDPRARTTHRGQTYVESDTDAEMLIFIPFNQKVTLQSLGFTVLSSHLSFGPRTVYLFPNRWSLDFDDALTTDPAQTLTFTREDLADGTALSLSAAKFSCVDCVWVFVASNQGGEEVTRMSKMGLLGRPLKDGSHQKLGGIRGMMRA
ncbi:unnamed protein product [Vitrella brassicaformis CCMP3155]|uniref:PITH domain-containing protein n=2 Tax=Vitrella brassicaformis TaxID=1169539 RepID=A0A0G4FVI8_VITBC|nr:unnamed protein product [Vitrella brassicaformis CCMP3155]|mmetsp:Transcript_17719/g.42588  ORF Transcript_17719/g.42588 Transcript_17719/m.42588 type:complete len:207 (+) Transcript_17719:141-761(+)|eukprot:CEM19233.1 unnamed protein product [Vitrella brassicaformis CCMP3155]